ncbi:hypothetical protein KIN34_05240 [Cellulomonas sp. DKR-3]|uniref:DUF559 domain-containing protein n=1 Tax=Cellulomonas fulva TaxID=2835530 RepID=A0ABS5TX06_9CELL|nr:hypothetical protein [Cellulomonas fulva]MBT0993689.1 hypothetical protein [Cellulomonas fulva]
MPRRPGSPDGTRAVPRPMVFRARDHPDDVVAAQVAAGKWRRVGTGTYVPAAIVDPRALAVARARGVHGRTVAPHAFSHETAAVLHGLALWSVGTLTHLKHAHRRSAHADPAIRHHRPLPADEQIVTILGMPVTDLRATAWDCAVSMPPLPALVVVDSALRAGVPRDDLTAIALAGRGRGSARGRLIIELADDGAESVRETMARFAFLRAGWPPPQTQVEVHTARGVVWADLGWPEWKVVVEYDGLDKYRGREREALLAEKLRREAFLEAGWRAVHLTVADSIAAIIGRTRRALPPGCLPPVRPVPLLSQARRAS